MKLGKDIVWRRTVLCITIHINCRHFITKVFLNYWLMLLFLLQKLKVMYLVLKQIILLFRHIIFTICVKVLTKTTVRKIYLQDIRKAFTDKLLLQKYGAQAGRSPCGLQPHSGGQSRWRSGALLSTGLVDMTRTRPPSTPSAPARCRAMCTLVPAKGH